jgi:hypothetical protein
MPSETRDNTPAPEISVPVDLPPFDFQLRGPVYNPLDWYWKSDNGRIYSSAQEKIVAENNPQYQAWTGGLERIRVPTRWPRDVDGNETVEALREVVAAYGKQVPE